MSLSCCKKGREEKHVAEIVEELVKFTFQWRKVTLDIGCFDLEREGSQLYTLNCILQKYKSRRELNGPVKRWPMESGPDDPKGCGYPVCALIDAKPKRFKSICHMVQHMKENGFFQQVLHFQKGDCADASKFKTSMFWKKYNARNNIKHIV